MMTLTFSVRNNPEVFALLLGSGISSEAGVLTGWGVLEDLIRKMDEVQNENSGIDSDPIEWYRESYGEEPRYDKILGELARSPEERQALLEDYFEPTSEEREGGIKTPSKAHESIAWLVDEGYINVIITTNFDRLLEQALEDRGITPTVISTAEEAIGAAPLAHQDAVVLKVNGDYKETNIKNTEEELEEYDTAVEELLEQIFDEYGLIVCGWSGKWDTALREAIIECESRRYSTFWAYHGELEEEAEKIVRHRDGVPVQIDGASDFFHSLKENIQSLEDAEAGAPLTRDVAREKVKRYMTREEHRIDLADLLHDETERVFDRVFDESRFPVSGGLDEDGLSERLDAYEAEIETLVIACATCAYWGTEVTNPAHEELSKVVSRLGSPSPHSRGGNPAWEKLERYPATYLIYAIGVASIESENWKLIRQLLLDNQLPVRRRDVSSLTRDAIQNLHPFKLSGYLDGRNSVFIKNRIKQGIRSPLREFLPDDSRYKNAFSEFELLADLIIVDLIDKETGRLVDVNSSYGLNYPGEEIISEEIESKGEDWGALQAGLFDGSVERVEELLKEI